MRQAGVLRCRVKDRSHLLRNMIVYSYNISSQEEYKRLINDPKTLGHNNIEYACLTSQYVHHVGLNAVNPGSSLGFLHTN